MSGEISDISNFLLEWFKWVMFVDETAPFPDDVLKLGCYLVPSKGIGLAEMTMILIENRQVIHTSMYTPWAPDELSD